MHIARVAWSVLLVCVFGFAAVPLHAQTADLGVLKDAPATAAAGSNVTYTITMQNNGPDDATSAQFDDPLPAGMTFVSINQTSGPPFTCADPGVGNNGTVTCGLATLTNGAVATFSLVANIPAMTPPNSSFTNIVSVTSATPDPNSENESGTAGTFVPGPQADVGVAKTGPATTSPNSDISYAISVTNSGPDAATNVAWSDTLPGDLTFVSFTQNSGPAFNCGAPSATVTCTIASLAAGASATFTFVGHVPNGEPGGTNYTNTVSVTSDSDSNPENDSATTTAVVSSADIAVVKSAPATAVAGGPTFDYTITLTNNGPDQAINARFTDILPSGVTFSALTQNSGPTASCVTPPAGSGGTVACGMSALFNGQSAQFTLTVAVANSVSSGTVLSNTVTASTDSVDANPGNNSSSASTTVTAQADLAIVKSGPAAVSAGSSVAYTLTLSNSGPSAASTVSLSDTLPAGETFVSITQNSGPAFNCTGGATVTCSSATLASGASAAFTLVASVDSGVANGTVLSNTATVASTSIDPNGANNSSTVTSTVQATADLALTKAGPASVTPGGTIAYALTLTNNGPASAAAVTLTDTLPAGETFLSLAQNSGPAFVCTTPAVGAGGTITCTIANLAPSAVATFTLSVAVPSNTATGGTLTNTATVGSSTADPNGANSSASASATVVAVAAAVPTPMLNPRALWLLIALLAAVASSRIDRRMS